jgi:hypothetical protein
LRRGHAGYLVRPAIGRRDRCTYRRATICRRMTRPHPRGVAAAGVSPSGTIGLGAIFFQNSSHHASAWQAVPTAIPPGIFTHPSPYGHLDTKFTKPDWKPEDGPVHRKPTKKWRGLEESSRSSPRTRTTKPIGGASMPRSIPSRCRSWSTVDPPSWPSDTRGGSSMGAQE